MLIPLELTFQISVFDIGYPAALIGAMLSNDRV